MRPFRVSAKTPQYPNGWLACIRMSFDHETSKHWFLCVDQKNNIHTINESDLQLDEGYLEEFFK